MMAASAVFTHPGRLRSNNEDSYLTRDAQGLWIVCDGMGGHKDGNYASRLITDCFELAAIAGSIERKIELCVETLSKLHRILEAKSKTLDGDAVIGATIALLLIDGQAGATIYAGDSRCYVLRSDRLMIATEDHAATIESQEGARKYLTKAFSAPAEFGVDIKRFAVEDGDVFLLCTDGFYDSLSTGDIKRAMSQADMKAALEDLGATVLANGAEDNLTGVMVRV